MPNAGMQVSPTAQPILNLRTSLFWDFMQRILVVTVSGQPIGPETSETTNTHS